MKSLKNPLSIMRGNKYNILINMVFLTLIIATVNCYDYFKEAEREDTFKRINIVFNEVKAVQYGTTNYSTLNLVNEVKNGKIISYTKEIDTNKLGEQDVEYVVEENGVKKVISTKVVVVDLESPVININSDTIDINVGDEYNLQDNIASITDNVDGSLNYSDDKNCKSCYNITTDLDNNNAGSYTVNINAIDNEENKSSKSFTVNVNEVVYETITRESNVDTSSVVSAALSFVGYNYTYGGASPETGFDCTGFVHYIYSLFGYNTGRSTSDIIYDGSSVSYDNMQAGDIIIWTDNGYGPTHASIYIGNGNMVHAANSNDGVIISNVNSWDIYAGDIYSIRRI